jgi:hypothetical protein
MLMGKMQELPVYISGSFPLSITHPNVQPNDLDLYVNRMKADNLIEFLVGQGYDQPRKLGREDGKGSTSYKEGGGEPERETSSG